MKLIDRLRRKDPFSLRTKLILSFIVIIFVGGSGTTILGTRLVANTLIRQAQKKVTHDLASAWMIYNEKLNEIKNIISFTAARESIAEALQGNQRELLDILTLTNDRGEVIVRTRNTGVVGDSQSQDEIVHLALQNEVVASTQIIPKEELLKEGQDLVKQAYMAIIPTPKAKPRKGAEETTGMMLKAAAPIVD